MNLEIPNGLSLVFYALATITVLYVLTATVLSYLQMNFDGIGGKYTFGNASFYLSKGVKNFVRKGKRRSKLVLVLKYSYIKYLRIIPRGMFRYSMVTVSIFVILTSLAAYSISSNGVVAVTAFYASFLFYREIFSQNPYITILSGYSLIPGSSNLHIAAPFRIANLGEERAVNISIYCRVYNGNGVPLSHWKSVNKRRFYETDILEPLDLDRGGVSSPIIFPFGEVNGFTKEDSEEIKERAGAHDEVFRIESVGGPIYLHIKTRGPFKFPFLADNEILRVNTEVFSTVLDGNS